MFCLLNACREQELEVERGGKDKNERGFTTKTEHEHKWRNELS